MLQQKLKLVESMAKLIGHISDNTNNQIEIYNNLPHSVLSNIISNFSDENMHVRRVSAELLCSLFYNNHQVQAKFLSQFQIQPSEGNIVLNKIQDTSKLESILSALKHPIITRKNVICWYIRFDKGDIQFLEKGEEFIDPLECLFGIVHGKEERGEKPLQFGSVNGFDFQGGRREGKSGDQGESQLITNSSRIRNDYRRFTEGEVQNSQSTLVTSFQRNSEWYETHKPLLNQFKTTQVPIPIQYSHPQPPKIQQHSNPFLKPRAPDYKQLQMPNTTRPVGKSFHQILGQPKTNRETRFNTTRLDSSIKQIYFKNR